MRLSEAPRKKAMLPRNAVDQSSLLRGDRAWYVVKSWRLASKRGVQCGKKRAAQ